MMEKAILKTLVYADIFDYPLKAWEIQKWLIKKEIHLHKLEGVLHRLVKQDKIGKYKEFYFLPARKGLVNLRLKRRDFSSFYLQQAVIIGWVFKLVPFVKLVGISGNLAMENSQKYDDIDFFVITAKNRVWISRFLMLGILTILRKRRYPHQNSKQAVGRICLNLIIDEDHLAQNKKDLFTAHEVLQMRVLWERKGIYKRFLEQNEWVFGYLPNWKGDKKEATDNKKEIEMNYLIKLVIDILEHLAQRIQKRIMRTPKGDEMITEQALYFHPRDYRKSALKAYQMKLEKLSLAS